MTSGSSVAAQNIALMHRFVREVQQGNNLDLFNEIVHPDFIDHTAKPGQKGRDEIRKILSAMHASFEDLQVRIEHCVSDEKIVATNKVVQGRLIRDFLDMVGRGQVVTFRIMDFVTVVDGTFREHWATTGSV